MLLERETYLQALHDALERTAAGSGSVVLVSGEAGIGKTALVQEFVERRPSRTRLLQGACDALIAPRPLGPLYDIALQTGTELLARLEAPHNHRELFAHFLAELRDSPQPNLVIIEDIHWADEATLDLIKFLGRRIEWTPTLLLLTYREDEPSVQQSLRPMLGDLPAKAVQRLRLPPLSEAAVDELACRAGRAARGLYSATGGNPFFVTEVLEGTGTSVPATVRDAVIARTGRLSPAAAGVLRLVSVVPSAMDRRLLEAAQPPDPAALDECVTAALLITDGRRLAFRHELARQAVEASLDPLQARKLHARVLQAGVGLGDETFSLAQCVHHAAGADDGAAVLRFAPAAAQQASRLGAHRQAAAHYGVAKRYAWMLPAEERAELLDAYALECRLTDQLPEAERAQQEALELWRGLGRREREGRALVRLSEIAYKQYRMEATRQFADQAVAVLETQAPSRELALAYSQESRLHADAEQFEPAIEWGSRALALAGQFGDLEVQAHALGNIGTIEMKSGRGSGQAKLERSLQVALDLGLHDHAARAYENRTDAWLYLRNYAAALESTQAGLEHCAKNDLDFWQVILLGQVAQAQFEPGEWAAAEQTVGEAMALWPEPMEEVLYVQMRLAARRGAPIAPEAEQAARRFIEHSPLFDSACQFAAIMAEAAWLRGDLEQCRAEAEPLFEIARTRDNRRASGDLALWLWRVNALTKPPENAEAPYAAQIGGDWRGAAQQWAAFGCPYERGLALMDGDKEAQHQALAIFERLGAAPAAAIVRRNLRAAGVRRIPRGPRPATRKNPYHLTPRQMDILRLLAKRMTNAQIAAWLHLSTRTVEHHVAAILSKLNVNSREAAAQAAVERKLLPPI